MAHTTATISRIITENSKVRTFELACDISASPGQFVMVWLPQVDEKPFCVVSPSPLTISIAKVGAFTTKIWELKEGDKVAFRGPYGKGFSPKGKEILLVGGGYGAAPLYFLASQAKAKGIKVNVVLGARTADELLFEEKFAKLGCNVVIATNDGSKGLQGFSTIAAFGVMDKTKIDAVYSCGPEKMMQAIAKECQKRKIPCQLSLERFCKCGFGICGSCTINGYRVCQDGPVFEGEFLLGLDEFGAVKRSAAGQAEKM